MLNNEEVLSEIIKILDLDLKDIKRSRFINQEETLDKYSKHIQIIIEKLNIQNGTLEKIFINLFFEYEKIRNKLIDYDKEALQKRLNWVLLKRLVIPYLAYYFAINKIDFDIDLYFNIKESERLKTPINNIMDWWIDKYEGNFTDLCDQINSSLEDDEDNIDNSNPTNTLSEWRYRKELPKIETIEKYCSLKLTYKNDINYSEILSNVKTARILYAVYKKLNKYFEFKDINNIEENKLLQLVYLFKYLFNIQNERIQLKNNYYDINNLGKNYLTPIIALDISMDEIRTLFADITIDTVKDTDNFDLENEILPCDDIYSILKILYNENKNNNLEKVILQEHKDNKIFTNYYNDHFKANKYLKYSKEEVFIKLKTEKSFQCMQILFKHYKEISHESDNIDLALTYANKMSELITTEDEKTILFRDQISFHTIVSINTKIKSSEVENIIKQYKVLLNKQNIIKSKEKELLRINAYFYLKSKKFKQSFECFDKYFNMYILKKKKDITNFEILMMCAYTTNILINNGEAKLKRNLKAYNRILNNLYKIKFTTKKDIPFPICFYK